MLLKNAQLVDLGTGETRNLDLHIDGDRIDATGQLEPHPGEPVIDATGNAVVPGLRDHHVHFLSYAASLSSVHCGPPAVNSADSLIQALAAAPGDAWLRGYGYHESVAGDIDRTWLDRHGPERPIRLQHRTGRLWIFNSRGIDLLQQAAHEKLTTTQCRDIATSDGRLYDMDELLRELIEPDISGVAEASRRLAAFGVTGINDMTLTNSPDTFRLFQMLKNAASLKQIVRLSGKAELSSIAGKEGLQIGCTKVHLHETALPPFDKLCDLVRESHGSNRSVAVHCVTETELVFALAAFRDAGTGNGDRIEHASVTPPALVEQLLDLGLAVVTQPGFIFERGDAYLAEIREAEHAMLYRGASFIEAGIPLAFATDMPFGGANPWAAMQAAVDRVTAAGHVLGPNEAVSPEFALGAFIGSFDTPASPGRIEAGCPADLCLLDRPWARARDHLAKVRIRATLLDGELIHLDN